MGAWLGMRAGQVAVVALGALALSVQLAAAGGLDRSAFRYQRTLTTTGTGPAKVEPDGPLFAHTEIGFGDLRIVDADGRQIAWRPLIEQTRPVINVRALNRGREGATAVALLDLGEARAVHDRLELDIPDQDFVGHVDVLGSDDRKTFTRLSRTVVYDISGAEHARSTTVVYPPSDFRYLSLRATGVSAIGGATVSGSAARPRLLERAVRRLTVRQRGSRTVIAADLGFERMPVDQVVVSAATRSYERPVEIEGSNDRRSWVPLATGRLFAIAGSRQEPVALAAGHRYLRATIDNGDDRPLADIRVRLLARSRALLVAADGTSPYRLLYGDPGRQSPSYDYARLPASSLDIERAGVAVLGAETINAGFEEPPDTRSFAARHPAVVKAALVLAAAVIAAAGLLALRRST